MTSISGIVLLSGHWNLKPSHALANSMSSLVLITSLLLKSIVDLLFCRIGHLECFVYMAVFIASSLGFLFDPTTISYVSSTSILVFDIFRKIGILRNTRGRRTDSREGSLSNYASLLLFCYLLLVSSLVATLFTFRSIGVVDLALNTSLVFS